MKWADFRSCIQSLKITTLNQDNESKLNGCLKFMTMCINLKSLAFSAPVINDDVFQIPCKFRIYGYCQPL